MATACFRREEIDFKFRQLENDISDCEEFEERINILHNYAKECIVDGLSLEALWRDKTQMLILS